jgi:hypothetical protein
VQPEVGHGRSSRPAGRRLVRCLPRVLSHLAKAAPAVRPIVLPALPAAGDAEPSPFPGLAPCAGVGADPGALGGGVLLGRRLKRLAQLRGDVEALRGRERSHRRPFYPGEASRRLETRRLTVVRIGTCIQRASRSISP